MRWRWSLLKNRWNFGQDFQPSERSLMHLLYGFKTAYIAMKLGEQLSYSKAKRNKLFYKAITLHPDQLKIHTDPVVAAAVQMIEWCEKSEDLPEKIHLYHGENNMIRAMQTVYFDHKKKLFSEKTYRGKRLKPANQEIWLVYRDVLAAATQNKLRLIEAFEIDCYKEGFVLIEENIENRSDISLIRNKVRKCFEKRQYSKTAIMSLLLVLSEAMTNVFKHAGSGQVTIVEKGGALHFIVEDSGTGIPLEQLPKATLLSGYSSQNSLGQGFTVILKIASCVHLHTSDKGSSLVITFDYPDKAEVHSDHNAETAARGM